MFEAVSEVQAPCPIPTSIELRTVDRLTPFTLQLARSGLQALLRNGNTVEARVIAMLAKNVAQLEILGQKVEVSTPQALEAGTTISVAINRNGKSLELVIRPDTNTSRPPTSTTDRERLRSGLWSPRRNNRQFAICGGFD